MNNNSVQSTALLRSDEPLKLSSGDFFGRAQFARNIAHAIAKKTPPGKIVIGIYGKWGEGKTTVINFIEEELESQFSDVLTIHFNPWDIADHQHLLLQFFTILRNSLGLKLDIKEVNEAINPYITAIGSLAALHGVPGLGVLVKSILKSFESSDVVAAKKKLNELLTRKETHVVVFIDDIDRLDTEEVSVLFKLIKNVADFKNTTYVLAFDQVAVSSALNEKFPGGDSLGNSFIEKIIQVPLHVPPARYDDLWRLFSEELEAIYRAVEFTIPKDRQGEFFPALYQFVSAFLDTPRQIMRALNVLSFSLPLLKGEVDVFDQTLIELVKVCAPQVHRAIYENSELFVAESFSPDAGDKEEIREKANSLIEASSKGYTNKQKKILKDTIGEMFPTLNEFHFGSTDKADWHNQKRISVPEYFRRYFSYALFESEVSDVELDRFLSELSQTDFDIKTRIEHFRTLLDGSDKRLISLLRYKEKQLNESQSRVLITLLAKFGGTLPDDDTFIGYFSSRGEAAKLTTNLLENIDSSDRPSVLLEFVKDCESFEFLIDTYRTIRRNQKLHEKEGNESLLSEKEFLQFESEVVSVIKTKAEKAPLYSEFPTHSVPALSAWKTESVADVERYLLNEFKNDPCGAIEFLVAIAPRESSDGRNWVTADFGKESYDRLSNLVSPQEVLSALARCRGELPTPTEYVETMSAKGNNRDNLVDQFLFVHDKYSKPIDDNESKTN